MNKKSFKLFAQAVATIFLWPIVIPGVGIYYIQKSKSMSLAKNSPLVFTLIVLSILISNWWFPILFNQTATNPSTVTDSSPQSDVLGDQGEIQKVKVVRVVDGDTIIVSKDEEQVRVRLIGIDAPEVGEEEQCFGKQAAERLTQLITAAEVELVPDQTQDKFDRYGRLLAYVVLPEGKNINLQLVQEGMVREYTYEKAYKFQSQFIQAQTEARAAKLGMWGAACKCEQRELGRVCSSCDKQKVTYQDWSCQQFSKIENALAGQCNCSGI